MNITVAYEEMYDSPVEDRTTEHFAATRYLLCNWSDRLLLRDQLLSTLPPIHIYPHSVNVCAMVTKVGVRPFGKHKSASDPVETSHNMSDYDYALVQVEYETYRGGRPTSNPDQPTGPRIAETLEPTMEYEVQDHTLFKWSDRDLEPNEAPSLQLPGGVLVYTRYHLAQMPQAILDLNGAVNNGNWRAHILKPLMWYPEQLRCSVQPVEMGINQYGQMFYNVTVRLAFRVIDTNWNKFWRPELNGGQGGWDSIKIKSSGQVFKPFKLKDFTALDRNYGYIPGSG